MCCRARREGQPGGRNTLPPDLPTRVTAVARREPGIPNQAGPVVDTSFLTLAGAMALVAVAGRGIGWALDAWVRRAADPLARG